MGSATVMATRFRAEDGTEHDLSLMSEDDFRRWHCKPNRHHFGTGDPFCIACTAPVVPFLTRNGNRAVRHASGHSLDACAYADAYRQMDSGKSHVHREAAANIVIETRAVTGWDAEPEKTFTDGLGSKVRVDVFSWTPGRSVIHEVQLSPQGYDETVLRTNQRSEAVPDAEQRWWSPSTNTVGELHGFITDSLCKRVVARCYDSLEPLVPASPTIGQVVRRSIRKQKPWVLVGPGPDPLTGERSWMFVPQSVGSTVVPRRLHRRGTAADVVHETGCDRAPLVRTADSLDRRAEPLTAAADGITTEELVAFMNRADRCRCHTCLSALNIFNAARR